MDALSRTRRDRSLSQVNDICVPMNNLIPILDSRFMIFLLHTYIPNFLSSLMNTWKDRVVLVATDSQPDFSPDLIPEPAPRLVRCSPLLHLASCGLFI